MAREDAKSLFWSFHKLSSFWQKISILCPKVLVITFEKPGSTREHNLSFYVQGANYHFTIRISLKYDWNRFRGWGWPAFKRKVTFPIYFKRWTLTPEPIKTNFTTRELQVSVFFCSLKPDFLNLNSQDDLGFKKLLSVNSSL